MEMNFQQKKIEMKERLVVTGFWSIALIEQDEVLRWEHELYF